MRAARASTPVRMRTPTAAPGLVSGLLAVAELWRVAVNPCCRADGLLDRVGLAPARQPHPHHQPGADPCPKSARALARQAVPGSYWSSSSNVCISGISSFWTGMIVLRQLDYRGPFALNPDRASNTGSPRCGDGRQSVQIRSRWKLGVLAVLAPCLTRPGAQFGQDPIKTLAGGPDPWAGTGPILHTAEVTSNVVPSPARVLIVDDERALAQILGSYLVKAGYEVHYAADGPAAVAAARELDPEVILLDLGLPGLDGLEVCRQVRMFTDCYILMLTARDDETDRIIGLGVGADDYIGKPFSPREVVARVNAVLRRPRPSKASANATPAEERRFGDIRIDPASREVWVGDQQLNLTRTEFDILDVLSSQPRVALSRRQIIDQVWNSEWVGDDHVVNVHVANLRRKLGDDPDEPRYLLTVRGVGYRMNRPESPHE